MTSAPRSVFRKFALLAFGVAVAACADATSARAQTPDYAGIVAAADRSEGDREIDKRRDPVKLLAFTEAKPGMKVLDMGAGGGYSTELMARAVAPNGVVHAQNAPDLGGRAKENFEARLKTAAMQGTVVLLRKFDDPVPADVRNLDLITFFFYYHDVVNIAAVDRGAMNRKLLEALKPGGVLVIADHSAKQGQGLTVTPTLHRIEESILRGEIEAAGFKLVEEGGFLRQPGDARDFNVNRRTGPVDEFVLKFQKPM
jgi:predicted methyltransferase